MITLFQAQSNGKLYSICMEATKDRNPYRAKPERKVTLLWHDIVLAKEKRKARLVSIATSLASFAIGFALGSLP